MGNWNHHMDMWGDGGGLHGWMGAWWILVILVVSLLVILAVRALSSTPTAPMVSGGAITAGPVVSDARRILEERLARGEISADEFRELIDVLKAT